MQLGVRLEFGELTLISNPHSAETNRCGIVDAPGRDIRIGTAVGLDRAQAQPNGEYRQMKLFISSQTRY